MRTFTTGFRWSFNSSTVRTTARPFAWLDIVLDLWLYSTSKKQTELVELCLHRFTSYLYYFEAINWYLFSCASCVYSERPFFDVFLHPVYRTTPPVIQLRDKVCCWVVAHPVATVSAWKRRLCRLLDAKTVSHKIRGEIITHVRCLLFSVP